jgi:hypothetical protein
MFRLIIVFLSVQRSEIPGIGCPWATDEGVITLFSVYSSIIFVVGLDHSKFKVFMILTRTIMTAALSAYAQALKRRRISLRSSNTVDSEDAILPAACDENTSAYDVCDFDSEQSQYCRNSTPAKARRFEEEPLQRPRECLPAPPRGRANDFDSHDSEKSRRPRQTSRVPDESEPVRALSPSATATHQ